VTEHAGPSFDPAADTTPVSEIRAEIACQILDQVVPCPAPYHCLLPKPSCWQCARNGAFHRAALIALAEFPITASATRGADR
jgi:hypothetical protein